MIKEKEEILKHECCDYCLGRQFANKYKGKQIELIGAAVRKAQTEEEVKKLLDKRLEIFTTNDCYYCNGIFNKINDYCELVLGKMNEVEFNSFLIGNHLPEELVKREEELWEKIGIQYCIPLKTHVNGVIGRKLEEITGKKADFTNPDVIFVIDFKNHKGGMDIRPLFIYGRYKKLMRGIPQTKWPCRKCRGAGRVNGKICENCKGTGKQYSETVEELISEEIIGETEAKDSKFHGEGREDIDALMLGEGRPFIIEIIKPKRRNIDLKELEKRINKHAGGKVEVSGLRFSSKKEVVKLKAATPNKTYEVIIECDEPITVEELEKLNKGIEGKTIFQRTPLRVVHRRADKVRKRKVIRVSFEKIEEKRFKAVIEAEAGTYIKELVSGDEGRTRPSFSSILGKNCKCIELNVVKVDD